MTTQTCRSYSGLRNEEQEQEEDAFAMQKAVFTSYEKMGYEDSSNIST